MVLELLFPRILERKYSLAFVLSFIYTVIGIVLSSIMFPNNPSVLGVAFISILLLPTVYKLFSEEVMEKYGILDWRMKLNISEELESKDISPHFVFDIRKLLSYNKKFIHIYLLIFLGSFLAYIFICLVLNTTIIHGLFHEQLSIFYQFPNTPFHGGPDVFSFGMFISILQNNFTVLLLCFVISFLVGNGAIILIIWNASVWGIVFGMIAKGAAAGQLMDPYVNILIILMLVLPHLLMEALAYILAAISGGVISRVIITEKKISPKFKQILYYSIWLLLLGCLLVIISGIVETLVFSNTTIYQDFVLRSLGV